MHSATELKEKIHQAQESGDIASLYVLESSAQEIFDEESLGEFYTYILDMALERLTDTLESHRKMDLSEVQDFATARALYEYAMEHYSADQKSDASALFEVLSGISSDERFSLALKFHYMAADEGMSLDDFLYTMADLEETQKNGTFYISAFTKEAQSLLDEIEAKSMGKKEFHT